MFDRDRIFRGYRGFGVCRDLARLTALAQQRHSHAAAADGMPHRRIRTRRPRTRAVPAPSRRSVATLPRAAAAENIVLFPTVAAEQSAPALSPIERSAFRELSRKLAQRLHGRIEHERQGRSPIAGRGRAELPPQPRLHELRLRRAADAGPAAGRHPDLSSQPTCSMPIPPSCVERPREPGPAGRGGRIGRALHRAHRRGRSGRQQAADPDDRPRRQGQRRRRADQYPCGRASRRMRSSPPPKRDRAGEARAGARPSWPSFRSILDTATDGVILLDRHGLILSANRSAEALFGYEPQACRPRIHGAVCARERGRRPRLSRRSRSRRRREPAQWRARGHRPGPPGRHDPAVHDHGPDRRWDATSSAPCFATSPNGRRPRRSSLEAKRQAEKASSAKSDFLAKISHEIRTPLNAIIGFSEVMMEERFGPIGNERYREYLKDIHASGGHLLSLINDLLDLSKIEAGKLELTFTSVALNDLTQQCVAIMQPQANRERIIIRTSLPPALPQVVADARSVRQIVLNLLSNSIKFTGAGGQVIVSTALNDNGEVVLRVRDTGVGMSEKDHRDRARAVPAARDLGARGGGTGLGLPLTKALAEANRASFHLKSAPKEARWSKSPSRRTGCWRGEMHAIVRRHRPPPQPAATSHRVGSGHDLELTDTGLNRHAQIGGNRLCSTASNILVTARHRPRRCPGGQSMIRLVRCMLALTALRPWLRDRDARRSPRSRSTSCSCCPPTSRAASITRNSCCSARAMPRRSPIRRCSTRSGPARISASRSASSNGRASARRSS